jgi:DNA-directed RNA polymerase subunit M/transcription elongation factor TFIIS
MAQFCPECGGELAYDMVLRQYTCRSCGLTFTFQELIEARGEIHGRETAEEERKRRQKEYLKWWLSKK